MFYRRRSPLCEKTSCFTEGTILSEQRPILSLKRQSSQSYEQWFHRSCSSLRAKTRCFTECKVFFKNCNPLHALQKIIKDKEFQPHFLCFWPTLGLGLLKVSVFVSVMLSIRLWYTLQPLFKEPVVPSVSNTL